MRIATFDREKVLRAAMTAFMAKGYSKTSMQDLTKATGLHPGSIYCAFDNKKGLLLAALNQYHQDRSVQFQYFFTNEKGFLIQLKDYLDNIVAECVSCDAKQACLLTKALNELAEQDQEIETLICENLNSWQQALTNQFTLAQQTQQLSNNRDSQHLARFLMIGIYGLRTYAHTHPQKEVLQQLADQLYQDITA